MTQIPWTERAQARTPELQHVSDDALWNEVAWRLQQGRGARARDALRGTLPPVDLSGLNDFSMPGSGEATRLYTAALRTMRTELELPVMGGEFKVARNAVFTAEANILKLTPEGKKELAEAQLRWALGPNIRAALSEQWWKRRTQRLSASPTPQSAVLDLQHLPPSSDGRLSAEVGRLLRHQRTRVMAPCPAPNEAAPNEAAPNEAEPISAAEICRVWGPEDFNLDPGAEGQRRRRMATELLTEAWRRGAGRSAPWGDWLTWDWTVDHGPLTESRTAVSLRAEQSGTSPLDIDVAELKEAYESNPMPIQIQPQLTELLARQRQAQLERQWPSIRALGTRLHELEIYAQDASEHNMQQYGHPESSDPLEWWPALPEGWNAEPGEAADSWDAERGALLEWLALDRRHL